MRDRLIELITDHIRAMWHFNDSFAYFYERIAPSLADYLLANGVIVPPCKVGDILYLPISHRVIAYEVVKIKYDGDLLKIVTHNKLSGAQRTIWAMDVGSTMFLTRKEAEAKLKEVRSDG